MNNREKQNRVEKEQAWLSHIKSKPSLPSLPEFDPSWLEREPRHVLKKELPAARVPRVGPVGYALAATLLLSFLGLAAYLSMQKPAYWLFGRITPVAEKQEQKKEVAGPVKKAITLAVQGKVSYVRDEKSHTLHSGDALYRGDRVITGAGGGVDLLLGKGVSLRVGEKSEFILKTLQNTEEGGESYSLHLQEGRLLSQVNKLRAGDRYEVTTPTAIAGVRGTSFEVESSARSTKVLLIHGSVEVSKLDSAGESEGEPRILQEKEMVEVAPESALMMQEVPPARWKEVTADLQSMNRKTEGVDRELLSTLNEISDVKSEQEIEKIYNRNLEIIRLKDGRELRGVVAQQIKSKLIIHTAHGIFVVNSADLVDIQYLPSSSEEEMPEGESQEE